MAEYLLDNSSSIPEKVLNARSDDFESLHLFHHLKNASETFAGIRLPGLPSVRELTDIESLELPEIPLPLPNFFNNNNDEANQTLLQASRDLLNDSILTDNELFLEEDKQNEKRNSMDETSDNQTSAPDLNPESLFQLPTLPSLPNLDSLVTVSKVIPHLIPFVVADYKVKSLKFRKFVKCSKFSGYSCWMAGGNRGQRDRTF